MEVYKPREDSHLLEGVILKTNLKEKKCLDMGTGSGIQAKAMFEAGSKDVTSADINPAALKQAKKNTQNVGQLKTTKSNLFEKIDDKFDFIAFNPPYVPSDQIKWEDTDGGKEGAEVIVRFIRDFQSHLNSGGTVLLLISSLNNPQKLAAILDGMGFRVEVVREESLFFEKLLILNIKSKLIRNKLF